MRKNKPSPVGVILMILAVACCSAHDVDAAEKRKLTCRDKVLMGIRHSEALCEARGDSKRCYFTQKEKKELIAKRCGG